MKQENFTTSFIVDATPRKVFDAINNVRGWWSENIEGPTDKLNGEFSYHYMDVHRCRIKVTEMQTDTKIVWHVLDNNFKFTKDKSEWKNTHIIFDITEKNGKTEMKFTHQGLVPTYECYQVCHDAWTYYIQESLKMLVTTGKGQPTPKETESTTSTPAEHNNPSDTKSIYHKLLIKSPLEKVYQALTTQEGLAGWWTPDTIAKPEVGSILRFGFGPEYFKQMEVIDLKPYSLIKWKCIKAFEDWIGTTLTFELEAHQKGCTLLFHHDGWESYTPEMASCSFDWALFFRSLKFLCETGKGFPYPDFDK
ncbi:uncharacterized protein YndB with AHSA1/START domain [Flavobacterium sp. 28YEA47A]|uniref:SRPBCC family protein n=1 Tax=Flavobacterium sp. 28YEA47A TaxID=3156276 RepID=UPI00351160D5